MVSRNKVVILCCALGGHAVNIIAFSYGTFLPYVFSYLYSYDSNIRISMMHVHAPLNLTVATGTAWTFGIFQKYVRTLTLHIINGVALSLWMVVLYLFGDSYIVITVAIALTGFHAGQLHVYFSQRVTEEGKRYPSTANGFYGFLFGLAGLWGNIMGSVYINPWSVMPQPIISNISTGNSYVFTEPKVLERVPRNWLALAVLMFILFLPGYFVIEKKSAKEEEEYDLIEKDGNTGNRARKESFVEGPVQSVYSMTGLTLFLTTIGIGVSSMCAFDLFKDYGLELIHDDYFLNVTGMLIPIVGAIGRILWGTLGDNVSLKVLFVSGNTLSFVLQGLMYPARHNKFAYVINASVLSIMPGMMTLLPPSVKKYMGTHNIALKYGIILTGEVIGCVYYLTLTSLIRGYLDDMQLVLLLGIPAALAIVPTLLFIKDIQPEHTVISNGS